jgi:hypothetical protein
MFTKRAQSALEFLTTYGWAFLVILIMIGALSYFGVLDPSRFLPEKCVFVQPLGCQDQTYNPTEERIQMRVINGAQDMTDVTYVLDSSSCPGIAALTDGLGAALPGTWDAGQELEIFVECEDADGADVSMGNRPSARMTVTYTPTGATYPKTSEGQIQVKNT